MEGYKQHAAPFDYYHLAVFVSVAENGTDNPVPIVKVELKSQLQNFNITSDDYVIETGSTAAGAPPRVVSIGVTRTLLAQVVTIFLLVINWALASVSAWVTMVVYFRKEKPSDAVLLFPLTLAVTIPALRSLYIGSPPYGILIGTPQAPRP